MPITPTYPGVYVEEIPSGVHTITGVATSITAFLGRAPRGLVNTPVTINSYADFERGFGGLRADLPMPYAVRDFYLNGGSQAIIVRLFKQGADDGIAKATVGSLPLQANSPGAWGGKLTVAINQTNITDEVAKQYDPSFTKADLFNLVVQETVSGATETIRNLSVKDGPRRVDRVLPIESSFIVFQPSATPTAFTAPTSATPLNSGGDDGSGLDDATIEGSQSAKTGMYALENADLFNLLCIPPDSRGADTSTTVYQAALEYCKDRRAMLLVDSPVTWSANPANTISNAASLFTGLGFAGINMRNGALYFPHVIEADPLRQGQPDSFVPCGIVAGVMAQTDATRGVWKAPAGIEAGLNGTVGLDVTLTDLENGELNPLGINCLRSFPVYGRVVWGARTLRGADQLADDYKYVPVRRTALFIEESLYRGTKWVVFEPNDEPLWAQIRLNIGAFMHDLFRQGAFQGKTPREAYFVKCDGETTTQNDINKGIVNIVVGFAPLKPAEFVMLQIQQMAGQIQA